MIELTATGEWYHVSAERETSASKWVEGPLRKGLYQGKRNLSLVKFDKQEILNATTGEWPDNTIVGAELVLQRDTAYGSGPVTLCVAPADDVAISTNYVTRADCMNLAHREKHHIGSISGEAASVLLPVGTVIMLNYDNPISTFVIYHENDEAADSYVRFLAGAKLRLYVGRDDWHGPVWTRAVQAGDIICDGIRSHWNDMQEIWQAAYWRWTVLDRQNDWLTPPSLPRFALWPANIRTLQSHISRIYEAEGKDAPVFTTCADGMYPKAELINELSGYLDESAAAVLPSTTSLCAQQQLVDSSARYNESTLMTWAATDVQAGKYTEQRKVYVYEQGEKTVTVYWSGAGGWLFDKTNMAGMSSAKLRLKVTAASKDETQVRVVLYGIKVTQMPAGSQSYASVFDTTALGEADCIVGTQAEIQLSAYAVQQLREQDGGYGGIGIRYDNPYIECSRSAELLVNAGTAQEETENQGGGES